MPHAVLNSPGSKARRQKTSYSRTAEESCGFTIPDSAPVAAAEPRAIGTDAVARLTALLEGHAIDLAEVSDAIRACPRFEALVLRASDSLALAPATLIGHVEQAIVILGKDRLQVLVRSWARRGSAAYAHVDRPDTPNPVPAPLHEPEPVSPEVLYLSNFLHWAGLDEFSRSEDDTSIVVKFGLGCSAGDRERSAQVPWCVRFLACSDFPIRSEQARARTAERLLVRR
jgi:hypothetical protein